MIATGTTDPTMGIIIIDTDITHTGTITTIILIEDMIGGTINSRIISRPLHGGVSPRMGDDLKREYS